MAKLNRTEQQAWRGFLRVHDQLWKALNKAMQNDSDLNLPAYELLLALEEAGEDGLRMTELAHRLAYTAGGLTRLTDKLEGRGWIERRRSAADGRGFEVRLTAAGRVFLQRVHVLHLRHVRGLFHDKLTPDEQTALADIWNKLTLPAENSPS
ncbi:MAG: MarR family transcriptional regulator [Anaerolineae bacterium]